MKSKKKYGPVLVRYPITDGHSVRLQPRQGFNLLLALNEQQNWKVRLLSDFLIIESINKREDKDQVVYKISQKWDLQEWSKISNVFLGNVLLTDEKSGVTLRLCVQLDASNQNKSNIVTVVNPNNHLVKIEPSQLLQVVLYNKYRIDINSKHDIWDSCVNKEVFECLRQESVVGNTKGIYCVDEVFCPEPRSGEMIINPTLLECFSMVYSENQNQNVNKKILEHHFWFRLNQGNQQSYNNKANGGYDVGSITINTKNGYLESKKLDVMVSLRGSKRKGFDFSNYEMISHVAKNWNNRRIDLDNNTIFYPNSSENIDLTKEQNSLYLEVAQPSEYSKTCNELAFWRMEASKYATQIEITELESRMVNGKYVQRFRMDKVMEPNSLIKSNHAQDVSYIAAIKLQVEKLVATDFNDPRMITINLWRSKDNVAKAAQPTVTTLHRSNSNVGVYGKSYGGSGSCDDSRSLILVSKEYGKKDDVKDLYYTDIEIEEIDCSDLSANTITHQLNDVKPILDNYDLLYGYAGYLHSNAEWEEMEYGYKTGHATTPQTRRKKKLTDLWGSTYLDETIEGQYL